METWRSIERVPQIIVSNEGRVMYIPTRITIKNLFGKCEGTRSYGGFPTFGVWNKKLRRYQIMIKSIRKTYRIGNLVCEAFHGPPPFEGAVSMHIDENPKNNRASNLKWGTQKENLNAPGFLKYCHGRIGVDNPHVKGRLRAAASLIVHSD